MGKQEFWILPSEYGDDFPGQIHRYRPNSNTNKFDEYIHVRTVDSEEENFIKELHKNLTDENSKLKEEIENWRDTGVDYAKEFAKQQAEIARLREQNIEFQKRYNGSLAENKKLNEALKVARYALTDGDQYNKSIAVNQIDAILEKGAE
jgi:hypothetical protein